MKHQTYYSIKIVLLITQIITLTKSQNKKESKIEQQLSENQSAKKLKIINEYNVWLRIECYNITDYMEFQNLIATQAHVVKNETQTLKVYDCPLPDNRKSLGTLLKNLGIILYRNLIIRDNRLTASDLTKEQFKDVHELKRLTLLLKYLSQLPEDVFADATLSNLTTLDLYTNVTYLPRGLLANLKNLQYLNIGHNLESICGGQFQEQTKLRHLNLSKNKLINISSNIFGQGAAIDVLLLENNHLKTLPSEVFAKLFSLTKIDISFNNFENLPERLFQIASQLKEFILINNRINLLTLPEKFLSNLLQLTKIEIKCGLTTLTAEIFFNSTNIKEIIMKSNNLKNIPDNLLESQSKLIYLDLSYNLLKTIPNELFRNTLELKILKLSNNRLTTIDRNSLTRLIKLELLDLSCNQLNSQEFRIKLDISINLKYLYLQNNSLTDLFVLLGHLPQNLRGLNLSSNKIYQLLGTDLEQLLTDNLIMNLTYNEIQTIQLQGFCKQDINVLIDINYNPLNCDCKIVESMKILKGLNNKHLQFCIEYLTCQEPSKLNGRYVVETNEMELLCKLELSHLSDYKCPKECKCWLRSVDTNVLVDCTRKNLSQVPTLPSLKGFDIKAIEINLTLNQITDLPASSSPGYANCTKLILANNKLSAIDRTQLPENLTLLDLRQNYLKSINEDTLTYLATNNRLKIISLSKNQWQCDCSYSVMRLYSTTQLKNEKFADASQMLCHNFPATKYVIELPDLCHQNEMILIAAFCFCISLALFILAVCYKYKTHIQIWLYGHNISLEFIIKYSHDDENEDKIYDAFVSYSHKDEDFIANHLVPELENGHPAYKLCIHARDFLVGEYIPDQIVNAIAESCRVIVVLSKNFIQSEWAKLEFKEAYRATLMERRQKLIIIMYEDIGKEEELDRELKLYLKLNTYLKWGDPGFWRKLRFVMPHK